MILTHYSKTALKLTIKAFKLKKAKYETLHYAWEQIKPLLEEYMRENNIQYIKVDLRTRKALIVEPIPNAIKQFWVEQWLNNKISTEQLKQRLGYRFQNTHYFNFVDFLESVESWLDSKRKHKH